MPLSSHSSAFDSKKRTKGNRNSSDPTTVTTYKRVNDFPGEPFMVLSNKLYCKCCYADLSLKLSTIKDHIRGSATLLLLRQLPADMAEANINSEDGTRKNRNEKQKPNFEKEKQQRNTISLLNSNICDTTQ